MVFHNGDMRCISRRRLTIPQGNLLRTLCDGPINSQHLIHDADQSVETGLDCVAAVDGDLAVQDFL
jgi:hypothetical protein